MGALLVDDRWTGPHGIGRFASEVLARLPEGRKLGLQSPIFHPLAPIRLGIALNAMRPGLFFTPGFNAPIGTRIPLVLTVHDLNYVHCPENTDWLHRVYFELVVRPACRRAVRVLTVSDYSRERIIEWAGIRPDVVVNVGNGVSPVFCPGGARYDPGYRYILVVGNPRPHKNLSRLVEAFARAHLESDIRLVVTGLLEPAALSKAGRMGLLERIVSVGTVGEADLAKLYRGALCLAMPSLYEGFGLPVLEAMASGTPVLASSATALPEIAGDAAVLVDPRNVDDMAQGIVTICGREDLRSTLIGRGLKRAAAFSWESTARRVREALGLPGEFRRA
jgi:glycosyltransferase involved in cell wall biosynthesis